MAFTTAVPANAEVVLECELMATEGWVHDEAPFGVAMFRPSTEPVSAKPCRNALTSSAIV
jgi:hypothetical protein